MTDEVDCHFIMMVKCIYGRILSGPFIATFYSNSKLLIDSFQIAFASIHGNFWISHKTSQQNVNDNRESRDKLQRQNIS